VKQTSSAGQTLARIMRNPAKALFIGLIRFYQTVMSPGIPSRCKYYPSCSQYALDAVREYGALRGLVLGTWRVLRCNPLSYGGYDPVSRQTLFRKRSSIPDAPLDAENRHSAECCSGHQRLVRG
jgi:uncharacterized protein